MSNVQDENRCEEDNCDIDKDVGLASDSDNFEQCTSVLMYIASYILIHSF